MNYPLHLAILVLLWGYIYTSWSLMGRLGLVSFGHGAFMGIGAYTVVMLWNHYGLTPWLGAPAALVFTAVVALIIGYPCFRFRIVGHYFALVTLALAEVARLTITAARDYTGGSLGVTPIGALHEGASVALGAVQFADKWVWLAIVGAFWAGGLWVWRRVDRSMSRLALQAISEEEEAAASIGIHVTRAKLRREIDFFPSADAITNERRVRSAELDLSTIVQSNRLGYIKSSGLGPYLHVAPESGVTYLPLNLAVRPLRDVRVRQALAMAIDREFLTRKLLRGGQTPAYSFVPPGLEGYPDGPRAYWAAWTLEQRQAEARRLLAAAGYGPGHPLKLVVKHRNSADPTLFLPSVQADWKAIGVEAQLVENDLPVAYDAYEVQDFEVGDAGWISTDPMVFLDLNRAGTGGMNYGLYDNPAYDAELDAALDSPDLAVRAAHMRKAETMLLADMPLIPVYFIASRNLVNPQITGWVDNAGDQHGTEFLCRQPTPQTPETTVAAN